MRGFVSVNHNFVHVSFSLDSFLPTTAVTVDVSATMPTIKQEPDTVELKAQCLCKTHTFTATVPKSQLPLSATYCHCNSCRHVTGGLYSSYATWPGPPPDNATLSALRGYRFSDSTAILFCGTCGSPMFRERTSPPPENIDDVEVVEKGSEEVKKEEVKDEVKIKVENENELANELKDEAKKTEEEVKNEAKNEHRAVTYYGVFTGVLSGDLRKGEELVRVDHHIFLSDTVDGGAAVWLRRPNKDPDHLARCWMGQRGESRELTALPTSEWPDRLGEAPDIEQDLLIQIKCHCAGVWFELQDIMTDKKEGRACVADEMLPLPWYVDPTTFRILGSFDACDSCRAASGADMVYWTFSSLSSIIFWSGQRPCRGAGSVGVTRTQDLKEFVDKPHPAFGTSTLTYYESSPGVRRYFCRNCSATVFYAADDRDEMVDVAVGLLRTRDGARAESVISWGLGGPIGWREDMVNGWRRSLLEGVEREAEEYRLSRGLEKNWRRVMKEEQAAREAGLGLRSGNSHSRTT
ncbi:hypothetical protein QBC46DRAFT_394555 [Diplogelasinospora grovesii]|uniref:CENP-V/GFA domain-containing protein n=1 Tax=Diplogelasinospora grovesii TaxID=303347 RepID=A0AAN6N0R4_9PEZI|nr:hypothetical protein QBC46DRAFT_394555 [Diplogelasinospora grovesii]